MANTSKQCKWQFGAVAKFLSQGMALGLLSMLLGVASARKVRVGVRDHPPKIMAGQNGPPSSIMDDLLKAVAQQENSTLIPVPCHWDACLAGVESGALDLMPGVARTDTRVNLYDFHRVPALNQLKPLPLDPLKIDQRFVRDLLLDANDLSIVKAIIDMDRNLGLDVLAEGVATLAQHAMLRQAGCKCFQGDLFSHPVPVEQLPTSLPLQRPIPEPTT